MHCFGLGGKLWVGSKVKILAINMKFLDRSHIDASHPPHVLLINEPIMYLTNYYIYSNNSVFQK